MRKSGLFGAKAHIARLRKLSGEHMVRHVGQALFAAGELVRVEAQVSITTGNKTGQIYTHYFATIKGKAVPIRKRPAPHQASAPGEAPADDTGVLANNIETNQVAPLVVEVSSNARYAAAMEFGNSKVEARPYLAPARDAKKKEVVQLVRKAVDRAVKTSKS